MGTTTEISLPRRLALLGIPVVLILVADQLSKAWAVRTLAPSSDQPLGRIIEVVWTLQFNYAENTGMAFSAGPGAGRWIGLLVIVIVTVLVVVALRSSSRTQVILMGVVIGGALGNLVDRAFRADDGWLSGAVVDFIDMQWYPIFNIADAAVVVGGILLVFLAGRAPKGPDDGEPEHSDDRGQSSEPGQPVDSSG